MNETDFLNRKRQDVFASAERRNAWSGLSCARCRRPLKIGLKRCPQCRHVFQWPVPDGSSIPAQGTNPLQNSVLAQLRQDFTPTPIVLAAPQRVKPAPPSYPPPSYSPPPYPDPLPPRSPSPRPAPVPPAAAQRQHIGASLIVCAVISLLLILVLFALFDTDAP